MLSLSFRNESDSVIEKAKAKAAKPRRSPGPRTKAGPSRSGGIPDSEITTTATASASTFSSIDLICQANNEDLPGFSFTNYDIESFAQHISVGNSPASTIHPSVEERGINYFFANYVAAQNGPSRGHFHYLHQVASGSGLDDCLKASVVATGIAGLANVSKSSQLMSHARKEYISSLRNINAALASPTDATKDSTLVSIMVLAIFETTAGAFQLSLKAYTQHINGAAALIKLRGRSQLRTRVGIGIFVQVTSHLLVSCVQRELPIPTEIAELRDEAFANAPAQGMMFSDPAMQFMKTVDEFTILHAAIKDGTLSDTSEIINHCLKVDGNLAQIFANAPLEWRYESVYTTTNTDLLHDGYYDIYHDSVMARNWNAMRTVRIILNQVIRSHLLEGFSTHPALYTTTEYTALFQISTDTIVKLRDDILHSVPQHLGYVNRKPFHNAGQTPHSSPPLGGDLDMSFTDMLSDPELSFLNPNAVPEQSSQALSKDPNFPAIGGLWLLWPLFVAGNTHLSDPPIREYIKTILRRISDEMGIAQGANIASFMELSLANTEERQASAGLGGAAEEPVSR